MKRKWIVVGGAAAGGVAWYVYATSRLGVRKLPYAVVVRDGRFEIRDYPPLHLATTRAESESVAFRRLFDFISGGNAKKRKIAMTTPVLIERHATELGMAFVMPLGVAVPDAADDEVKVGNRPGGRIATLRFHGDEQRAIEELRRRVASRKLEPEGNPFAAYYDAPWMPRPLRRNEVMLRLR
ncbi:MAG TPA: heme-binding protein [Thermoanaerobaculia bacterium]|nr:heme-binding protein [Thermoanaerobaculia bacterium]